MRGVDGRAEKGAPEGLPLLSFEGRHTRSPAMDEAKPPEFKFESAGGVGDCELQKRGETR